MVQFEELGVVVEEEEGDGVVETKPDDRLQRRQRTRKVHRTRANVATLVAARANAHTRRAKRARKRGCFSPVLSGVAKGLRRKSRRLSNRFHVPVTLVTDASADGNGEE